MLRIDPDSNDVLATITVGGSPEGIDITDGGVVWLAVHAL